MVVKSLINLRRLAPRKVIFNKRANFACHKAFVPGYEFLLMLYEMLYVLRPASELGTSLQDDSVVVVDRSHAEVMVK